MTFFLELDIVAENHLERHIKAGNKILLKKIHKLFEELKNHPESGTGKPHKLKYKQAGIWSRSIDDGHRMLYVIDDDKITVFVISLWGHYDDK
ncbi:MAG: Txe/YoeB family addiction module toxin [Marinilabiliaceae bacterium]|nr:Txe/YoeB family addiction module toxin [Marinilabiliaceae bacterium]